VVVAAVGAAVGAVVAVAVVVVDQGTIMRTFLSINSKVSPMNNVRLGSYLTRLALALMLAVSFAASAAPQETFATPEAQSTHRARRQRPAMIAIFGDEHKDLTEIARFRRDGQALRRATNWCVLQEPSRAASRRRPGGRCRPIVRG
jgi:hypothetical protein